MSNEHHMRRAIALSLQMIRSNRGGPFGAVIVKDGRVIAEGANQVTSTNDPTAHAEIVAVRLACQALETFDLTGCEIYTSCEPCPMCLGAIYWAESAASTTPTTATMPRASAFATTSCIMKFRCRRRSARSRHSRYCGRKAGRRSTNGRASRTRSNTKGGCLILDIADFLLPVSVR
jgi:tRNA(Arg) A34 adenosine deaminase TadA